jgi:competence protein ComEC
VVRAAIMGGLGLVALRLGRRTMGLNTLAVAAWLMTAWNPLTLWDVGFQLSAAATLGLILYAEPLQAGLQTALAARMPLPHAERLTRLAADAFLLTFAAQLTTLPLIAYTFGQLSLVSLLANAVILPVQPAVMVLGLIALALGLVWLPLGQLAAWLAFPFAAYTLACVDFFARVPGASVPLEVGPAVVGIFYLALFTLTWMMRRAPEQRPAWWGRLVGDGLPLGGVAALSLVTFFAWGNFFALPEPGRLRVTLLEGGAVAITTPSGAHVLIGGGPSGGALLRGLTAEWPPYENELALLAVMGTGESEAGALPDVIARYRVTQALIPGSRSGSAAFRAALDSLVQQSVPITTRTPGTRVALGDGAQLVVASEGVLRVEWGAFACAILTAHDADGTLAPATVVAVSTKLRLDERAAAALDPRVVLLTDGEGAEVWAGRTALRADQRGALTVESDGARMWITSER